MPGLRLATRASALARAQAHEVCTLLGGAELVEVLTEGDRRRDLPDKQKWVSELEAALSRGEADLAVHSAKDVPTELPEGFVLAGVPARGSPWDALCGAASLNALAEGARVGTSSPRRTACLRALRPDLDVVELRGNVDTRLRRLAEGSFDAIVLAFAGLQRLGLDAEATCVLHELVPAPGQGSLLLEARHDDGPARAAAAGISSPTAHHCLVAERQLAHSLRADCRTAVGAHATHLGNGRLRLSAFVGTADGASWLRDVMEGDHPAELGRRLAQRLLDAGADAILRSGSTAPSQPRPTATGDSPRPRGDR